MSAALILGLVGGLLILAFVANKVFSFTRIPDVVVLMALGIVLGPVLGLVDTHSFSKATHLLGTLAIILVLFEGGLEIELRNTLRHFPGSLLLAFLAFVLSTGLVALIIVKGLGLSLTTGLLVGAVMGCTSSAVVLPVLQQMRVDEPVKVTLTLEASWGDVLAVLTVGLLLGLRNGGSEIAISIAHGFINQVGVALVFAVATGVLWSRLLPALSEQKFWQVLTFSVVLALYAGMEALHANGLIAVLGFGLTLANFPGLDPNLMHQLTDVAQSQQSLLTFHSELSFLVRTFFFVLIGAIADLHSFREFPLLMAGTIGALLVARWLAVHSSRWAWKEIDKAGREAIFWMLPRGLITIVLAIQVTAGRAELSFLPGLAFAVILVTNLFVVVGSMRSKASVPALADTPQEGSEETVVPSPMSDATPETRRRPRMVLRRKRLVLDAMLLLLLALSGAVLWYGNQPYDARPASLEWIRNHLRNQ
jgi:Na+:H+ antiporter